MNRIKNLSDLQLLIQESVQSRTLAPELMDLVIEKPPISISNRISIYQDAYQIRLLESLRDDFNRVESAIGEDEFEKLALDFIRDNPSIVRNLAEYSENFPAFVKIHHDDAFVLAMMDWLEVLSSQAQNPEIQLSTDEIQSGRAFKIQARPSTVTRQVENSRITFYRHDDETQTLDLTAPLFELLQFLETSRTVEELSQFSKRLNIDDDLIAKTVHEWIVKRVVYCQPI